MIEQLKQYELVYLATPYTLYEAGLDAAFEAAAYISAELIDMGLVQVFSPIVHAHAIAEIGGLDPLEMPLWERHCEVFLKKADCLLVAMMAGWRESVGIEREIVLYRTSKKPVFYLDVETYQVLDHPRDSQAQGAMVSGNLAR